MEDNAKRKIDFIVLRFLGRLEPDLRVVKNGE